MWEGARYLIGASVGVTGIDHRASTSAVLMGEADVACYAAKDRGRNQVVVFDRREANRVEDHLALPTGQ
jgi:diguanylate cyclase